METRLFFLQPPLLGEKLKGGTRGRDTSVLLAKLVVNKIGAEKRRYLVVSVSSLYLSLPLLIRVDERFVVNVVSGLPEETMRVNRLGQYFYLKVHVIASYNPGGGFREGQNPVPGGLDLHHIDVLGGNLHLGVVEGIGELGDLDSVDGEVGRRVSDLNLAHLNSERRHVVPRALHIDVRVNLNIGVGEDVEEFLGVAIDIVLLALESREMGIAARRAVPLVETRALTKGCTKTGRYMARLGT